MQSFQLSLELVCVTRLKLHVFALLSTLLLVCRLSELVAKFPETKQGLIRFLYEIILRRMEIRDKSRSVNSIDIVFNFDCIGFTGTPFIDNYPTFSYLRGHRQDEIPSLIDRSFYVYTSDALPPAQVCKYTSHSNSCTKVMHAFLCVFTHWYQYVLICLLRV